MVVHRYNLEGGMDRAIAGLLGGLLAIALAIVAIVYIGTFVVTVGAGLFGLVCVKTKRPIVPPNGFVLVPLAYAIIWAAAITLALLLGGSLLNQVRGLKHANPFVACAKDALLFFLEG